ncbi:MAG: hypothetical protein ABL983_01690 [Nitrospira sp.]
MNEPFLTDKDVVSIVKYSLLSLVFGIALGAFGMVYFEKPKPQPVVAGGSVQFYYKYKDPESGCVSYKKDGKPGMACPPLTDQRVKELRFSLQKLERLKDVHDATLKEAAMNQGEIRQMVKALEVGK